MNKKTIQKIHLLHAILFCIIVMVPVIIADKIIIFFSKQWNKRKKNEYFNIF